MYKIIEEKFFEFGPDICVNEGGDVSKEIYASKEIRDQHLLRTIDELLDRHDKILIVCGVQGEVNFMGDLRKLAG